MDLESLIDELEDLLEKAIHLPTGKALIDEAAVRQILQEMRAAVPDQLQMGQRIASERERILADAKAQAQRIIEEARNQRNAQLDEQAIVQAARQRAREIQAEAERQAAALRADANQGYSPKEAVQFCRLCERYGVGLELLEQPVAAHDLPGMAHVRRSVDTLIEADESCFTPQDALAIIRHEAADVLNIKLGKAGGFTQAKKIAALAEAAGLKCVLGTAFGLGLEIAAKAHLFAALEIVTDAVEFTELSLHGNLLKPPWDSRFALPLEDGCLPVPDGPGLGVEVAETQAP